MYKDYSYHRLPTNGCKGFQYDNNYLFLNLPKLLEDPDTQRNVPSHQRKLNSEKA